jgi:RNA polymerase primary sigma factor
MAAATSLEFFFQQMGRFERLDQATTIALAAAVQAWQGHPAGPDAAPMRVRVKGQAARDKLVRHNLRLVVHIWRNSYSLKLPVQHPGVIDALQTAAMNLVRAAEKYSPARGTTFSTYAAAWIHKGLRDYLTDEERLVRIPANSFHIIKAASAIICRARALGESIPTPQQLVDELRLTRKHVPSATSLAHWLDAALKTDARSLDARVGRLEEEGGTLIDSVADPASAEADEQLERVHEAMEFLSDVERTVLSKRYLGKGVVRHAAIAKQVGLSRSRVQQIEQQAIHAIRNLAGLRPIRVA